MSVRDPRTDDATLAAWGQRHLEAVLAIDSASDERSSTIPSTEGQRHLSTALRGWLEALGFACAQDAAANLLAERPATPGCEARPKLALMVHMDTARGTRPIEQLCVVPRWDGGKVPYPANDRLHVDVATYPLLQHFLGDDLLHGPGDVPFGLDDKLGMAELLTLAELLQAEPDLPHGPIVLVFRPDEEIGRMAAVEGLADELGRRDVRYGYTVDGLEPFEVNVENFEAGRVRMTLRGAPLEVPVGARRLALQLTGVNTHGATAKPEGYRNATVILARTAPRLPAGVRPIELASDGELECNARLELLVPAEVSDDAVLAAFERELAPLRRRGAQLQSLGSAPFAGPCDDAIVQLVALLQDFLSAAQPAPLLAEESEGRQGYSNPHRVSREADLLHLDVRLRDFDVAALSARRRHVEHVAARAGATAEWAAQYVNMGPALARHPELVTWARRALQAVGRAGREQPIRGGTGVDPFLARGIPVANLGTGYFAPESEKELTSRQNLARHARWLAALVQVVGA